MRLHAGPSLRSHPGLLWKRTRQNWGAEESHCCAMRAAVSWVRIEHCASPDLSGYKAARTQTLSASQLNSVSRGSFVGQNGWGRKTCWGKRLQQIGGIKKREFSPFYVCVFRLYQLTIPLSDQRVHVAFICHWNKANTLYHKVNKTLNMEKVLTSVKIVCAAYWDRRRDKTRQTAGGNEKEKPEETGILWLWEKNDTR